MKLGIFGGTFNPIHFGHLINAEFIRETFSLGKVLFVPAKEPVHKNSCSSVSAENRMLMVEEAISNNPFFEVSDIEVTRNEPSYTIYTVHALLSRYPDDDLYLIIGEDSYDEFWKWKDYRDIVRDVHLIVMSRYSVIAENERYNSFSDKILFAHNPIIDITSTEIREKIKRNQSIRYLVPEKVVSYIIKRGLYLD